MSKKPSYEELEKRVQKLEQAEEELTQIFSMSLDMICIADINTATFLKVNPAFTEILGHSEEELLEKPFLDFVHPVDIDATRTIIEQELKSGAKVINFENRYRCKDGSYRWLSWVSHPNMKKGITYAVARDITEWKQKEEELENNKALLDATGRMARVGGWELDADTFEVTWTKETYRIHEVPIGDKPPLQEAINFFHPEDRPKLEKAIQNALDHGEPYDMEIRFITANGKNLWTRTMCQPEFADGRIIKLKGTFQDITERKHAENALRESVARYRSVLETINEGVILQSASGEILTWNKGAQETFGISAKDAIGQTSAGKDWPTIHEDGSKYEGKDHPSMKTLGSGKPCRNEIMGVCRPSGEVRWISINTNPMFSTNSDSPEAVAISFTDITELKQIQDDIAKSERKLRQTLEATTDGIWEWNFKTNKLNFSPKYYKMLGYDPNEFPATFENWVNLIHPDDQKKALAVASKYLETKPDQYENEFRLMTRKGDYRWIYARARVVERDNNGEAVNMIGNHEDITERKQAEKMLQENEQKYRDLFESNIDGIIRTNLVGAIKEVNPAFLKMVGYDSVDDLKETYQQLTPEKWHAYEEDIVKNQVFKKGFSNEYEKEYIQKNGTVFPISIKVWLVKDQGKPVGMWGIVRDITERKRAEEQQRKLEAQLSNAMEMANLGHWEYDVENDLFTFNDQFYRIFRTTAEQVGGYLMSSTEYAERFLYPEDREMVGTEIRKSIETPDPNFNQKLEHRIFYSDGDVGHISVRYFIEKDNQGKTIKTHGVNQDITERIHARKRLQRLNDRLKSLWNIAKIADADVKTISDHVLNEIQKITDSKYAFFGFLPEDEKAMILHAWTAETTNDCRVTDKQTHFPIDKAGIWADAVRDKRIITINNFQVQQQGRKGVPEGHIPLNRFMAVPLVVEGKVVSIAAVANKMHDYTEEDENQIQAFLTNVQILFDRKRYEEEKLELIAHLQHSQRLEAIGDLAGGIAHDFNNILFPIIGMSELLIEDLPSDSPERENAEEILTAGQRGRDLVKQILAFSRQSEKKKIPTRVQQVLKEVLKLSRSTIPTYININQDIQPDCGLIMADPTQMHQVAMNIITNAYHALEDKGGIITVKLKEMILDSSELENTNLDTGRYAVLSFSDTGHGVSDDLINKIFDPYFTTKEKRKGTGLGLAVVYGIVKDHKGDIVVESEIGEGTTFTVYLPLMEKSARVQSMDAVKNYKGGSERILLVDDEETVANLEKKILERLGYKVTMRINSREALEAFKANPNSYDLFLSDMAMPNISGDQLATEIKSIRPDIPIIICTGFSERIDEEKAKTMGIDGLLMKPIVRAEIANIVRKVLDKATISFKGKFDE